MGSDTADRNGAAEAAVRTLLETIGVDADGEVIRETPRRVVKALREMTGGYSMNPSEILGVSFEAPERPGQVVARGIEFSSLCEHHLLPFSGEVTVGYLPSERIAGLSKLARLVDCFSRRLQLQERLTDQIASAIETELTPRGVGVVVRARHSCLSCRGARKPDAEMITSTIRGELENEPNLGLFLLEAGRISDDE